MRRSPPFIAAFFLLSATFAQGQGAPAQSAQVLFNEGKAAMAEEDYYAAAGSFLEALAKNPAHGEAAFSLAECYYELGEYDEALKWSRKARALSRVSSEAANLEAFILAALGRLDEADALVRDVLLREPYNREALFAAAELDVARGKTGEAAERFKSAVRRYPDDRRLLLSLAMVLGSLGDYGAASTYLERAKVEHSDDWRVFYYSAYLKSRAGHLREAVSDAESALELRPRSLEARYLLASLRYRLGEFERALREADEIINTARERTPAWFLKAMSLWRAGRLRDARSVFEETIALAPNDEFTRAAFELLLIESTDMEDPARRKWADYHFKRAETYKKGYLYDTALFEYRRGLRINPYAAERLQYAEILKTQGYPELYLDELKFIQEANLNSGKKDRAVDDAVETYTALLKNSLPNVWGVGTEELERHWNIAIFSLAGDSSYYHTDAAFVAAAYIKDIMVHDRNIGVMNLNIRENSFSNAFRSAREARGRGGAKCDYFLLLKLSENERDLSVKAELYLTRTGTKVLDFNIERTGLDRLRNASLGVVRFLDASLPFRAVLLKRNGGEGLIDKGKIDSVKNEDVFNIIKKGALQLKNDEVGFSYPPDAVTGSFSPQKVDEEVSAGTLSRSLFFDLIEEGDDVVLQSGAKAEGAGAAEAAEAAAKKAENTPSALRGDPELKEILMKMR